MIPNAISLLGLVALAALFLGARNAPGGMLTDHSAETTPDYWETPFYLRYNTPIASTQMAILPTQTIDSWSLAVGVY